MAAEQSEQQLASWLELSKSVSGREQLIESKELNVVAVQAVDMLVQWETSKDRSSSKYQQAIMLLRILRNACAAGSSAALILQDNRIHAHVAHRAALTANALATAVDMEQNKQQQLLLLTSLQLLANMSVACAGSACAVWEVLFPGSLAAVLGAMQGDVHEVAALTLLNCIKASSKALADLTSTAAGRIWLQLLTPVMAASSPAVSTSSSIVPAQLQQPGAVVAAASSCEFSTASHDNLCLLVKAVALQYDSLHKVMQCIQISTDSHEPCDHHTSGDASLRDGKCGSNSDIAVASDTSSRSSGLLAGLPCFQPNIAHALLLHIVQLEVDSNPLASGCDDEPVAGNRQRASSSICAPSPVQQQQDQQQGQEAHLLEWVRYIVCLLCEVSAQVSSSNSSRNMVATHVLEATLQVLKAVTAREDGGMGLVQYAAGAAGSNLASSGDCITQLHKLGIVKQLLHMLQRLGVPLKATQQAQQQQLQQSMPLQVQQQQPYVGYRADLVAVLSNMVHDRRSIQNDVMSFGGIEVLLNNCNLDDTAPLAREYALWAVRNMCKDNEAVQQYISKFQAVEAVQSEELDRLGKELQLDKMTNKLQLVDKPKHEQQR